MGLPRYHRLRKRQDFSLVYRHGGRFSSQHLTLRALSLKAQEEKQSVTTPSSQRRVHLTQVGISISQKVSKRAVIRNRIKRQIRAALHQLLPRCINGWKLVVVVHPNAKGCEYVHFLQELEQLLLSAEVIDGHT